VSVRNLSSPNVHRWSPVSVRNLSSPNVHRWSPVWGICQVRTCTDGVQWVWGNCQVRTCTDGVQWKSVVFVDEWASSVECAAEGWWVYVLSEWRRIFTCTLVWLSCDDECMCVVWMTEDIYVHPSVTELWWWVYVWHCLARLSCDRVKVFLLPLNAASELTNRSKFHQLFNVVYISNRSEYPLVFLFVLLMNFTENQNVML